MNEGPKNEGVKQIFEPLSSVIKEHVTYFQALDKNDPKRQFVGWVLHLYGNWFSKMLSRSEMVGIFHGKQSWTFMKTYTRDEFKLKKMHQEIVDLYPELGDGLNELVTKINIQMDEIVHSGKSREECSDALKELSIKINTLYAYACWDKWDGKQYIPGDDVAPRPLKTLLSA